MPSPNGDKEHYHVCGNCLDVFGHVNPAPGTGEHDCKKCGTGPWVYHYVTEHEAREAVRTGEYKEHANEMCEAAVRLATIFGLNPKGLEIPRVK